MPAWVWAFVGVFIGASGLTIGMISWWVTRSIKEFRSTVDRLSESVQVATKALVPLLTDPRFDDYGKALQAAAGSIPVINLQLKTLTELVAKFYGIAEANTVAGASPTEIPAKRQPNPNADDSRVFPYSETAAAAVEALAEAQARGLTVDKSPHPPGISAEA